MVKKILRLKVVILFALSCTLFLSACSRDEEPILIEQISEDRLLGQVNSLSLTQISSHMIADMEIEGSLPFPGESLHGKPNQTVYKFYVANPPKHLQRVLVRLDPPSKEAKDRIIFGLQKNSRGNFSYSRTLPLGGRYTVRYELVYSTPYRTQYLTPRDGYIDNTFVDFSGGVKKLVWPFGADGSSWGSRNGWQVSCGHGCNAHTIAKNEYYSVDWNIRRSPYVSAEGREIRSPLDGYVSRCLYHESGGNLITIYQVIGDKTYYFQVGHLQNLPSLKVGQYVRAGITKIGTVGKTGNASGPHAHTSLKFGGIFGTSTEFDFSARWCLSSVFS